MTATSAATTHLPDDVHFEHAVGASRLPLVRLGGPDAAVRFHAAVNAFRESSEYGFVLMPWALEDYADHALVVTRGGDAGLAVSSTGVLHSVFSSRGVRAAYGIGPEDPSPGDVLTDLAVRHLAARELHCFDNGVTAPFYARHGFVEVARFPFDPDQAIPGWRYGVYARDGVEPDFLVMRRPGPTP